MRRREADDCVAVMAYKASAPDKHLITSLEEEPEGRGNGR